MSSDYDEYERKYLERRAGGMRPESETPAAREVRVHAELVEAARKAAAKAKLDAWDYVVLEMLRRGDPRIPMKVGTVRSAESILRLFCHGLIARLDRAPTFDELERLQAFLDSAGHKRYVGRLKKLMTPEVKERLELMAEITGVRGEEDAWKVTGDGMRALRIKRTEIAKLYDKMAEQYYDDRDEFYENAESYMWAVPVMFAMGFGNGMMMAYMLSMSDVSCDALCDAGHTGAGQMADMEAAGEAALDMGFGL